MAQTLGLLPLLSFKLDFLSPKGQIIKSISCRVMEPDIKGHLKTLNKRVKFFCKEQYFLSLDSLFSSLVSSMKSNSASEGGSRAGYVLNKLATNARFNLT